MVRQKKAPAARRRPMSREEALARQERQQRRRELEQESRELAKGPIDLPFFILVMLLTGVGLVMLLSASFPSAYYETDGQNPMSYFIRQGVFAIMGVAAMLFIGKINYQRFRGLAKPLLYLAVILLILVIVPGNPLAITRNNATRWLGIPGTSLQFQPSEIAKLAVVIYFADSISKKKDRMQTFRYGIAPYAVLLIVLAALVGIEPHLSGAILIMGAGAVMMLVGGIHWRWVGLAMGAAGLLLYLVLGVIGYNASRIESRLPAAPEPHHHRLRRAVGRGPGEEPPEVSLSAGGAQRFHLRHRLRGAGPDWRHRYHAAVRGADSPGLLDRPPCPGPVRQPDGGGRHDPGGPSDLFEHRRGDGPAAHHRHLPAVFQLWRHGAVHPAGGDGHRPVGIPADEAYKGGVVRPRGVKR